ncbi:MAG: HXXEE domain-containing protein [Polyangiales bacterium]
MHDWNDRCFGCGLLIFGLLLRAPRPRDPDWIVCLMLPTYMLHQFEEYGVDLHGRHFHFLAELCTTLGYPELATCPADPWFVLAANVGGGVWIPGLLAILLRKKNPMVGACVLGIPLVNAVAHIGSGIAHRAYNSGMLTAAILFVPVCVFALRALLRAGVLDRKRIFAVIGSGVVRPARQSE